MRSKTRVIAGLASLLACAAMVGTGFASWVILSSTSTEATGNVKVEAVASGDLSMEAKAPGAVIRFAGPSTQETANAWLVSTGIDGEYENLTAAIELTVSGSVKEISVTIELPENFDTAVTNGLLAEPTAKVTCAKSEVTFDTSMSDGTIALTRESNTCTGTIKMNGAGHNFTGEDEKLTVTLTFGWGTAFSKENPYNYFNNSKTVNGTDISDWASKTSVGVPDSGHGTGAENAVTWGDVAKGVLGWLNNEGFATNGDATYKVTFSATAVNLA